MKIKNSEFIISAVRPSQYPSDDLYQIVLVGKSNVGKSSFINTMINRTIAIPKRGTAIFSSLL